MRYLLLALALSVVLGACGRPDPTVKSVSGAASGSSADAKGRTAVVLLLAAEDLHTLSAGSQATGPVISGSLQPQRRADLRAEVGAIVKQVLKDNGEKVRAGELIVRLDDTAIRDSLASAEEVTRAASQAFDQAERQAQRLKTLQVQGMVAMQALEDAEVRRSNAHSEFVAARSRVAAARQQLRRTEVRAPFDGVVSERKVSAGDTAQVGKELVKVIDPRTMRFEGRVSADRMHELKTGQAVSFRVNGYPQTSFAGKVRRIDASANAVTRQVEVTVDFTDRNAVPGVAGLFAEGRIETGATPALMLAAGSVIRAGEDQHVWRVNVNVLDKVAVKLGARDPRSGDFPVLSGLVAGDRVLRNPGGALVDGQKIEFARSVVALGSASAATLPAPASAASR